ncbi:hypothetical protein EDD30_2229 [Couchioplanes caeruleus]|uniref:Uncharacterized protein n=1 Tax=Couchioplanes caeruleus TaxID=56438 RepID=A0A3N1GGS2_9ACTN|nr:hypothetical protein EDD30_2229 [Couchioplanes caeruleus]
MWAGVGRVVLCGLWFLVVGASFLAMDLYM